MTLQLVLGVTANVSFRKCHIYSFLFSFLYLFFFRTTIYFGIPYPPSHTNLIQMMLTLKLIGLAFEVNSSYNSKKKRDEGNKSEEEKLEDELMDIDVQFLDVFYYVYNYCGILTGIFNKLEISFASQVFII